MLRPTKRNTTVDISEEIKNKIEHKNFIICMIILGLLLILSVSMVIFGVLAIKKQDTTETESSKSTTESQVVTENTMSDEDFFAMLTTTVEETEIEKEIEFYSIDREQIFSSEAVVGYINIPGTEVDYKVVQANDNAYYLDKNEDGLADKSGAIYGDYRNSFNTLDRNNVIYGHNMASGARFGTLTRMLSEDFYTEDAYIYFDTLYYNNIFKVYSVYEIDLTTFCYIQTGFVDDAEFKTFVERTQELNVVDALKNTDVPDNSPIITLSTCVDGGTRRLVVHGVLYAREME